MSIRPEVGLVIISLWVSQRRRHASTTPGSSTEAENVSLHQPNDALQQTGVDRDLITATADPPNIHVGRMRHWEAGPSASTI